MAIIGAEYWVWYDDEPKSTLVSKINQAIQHYQQKYGVLPVECRFNEKMIGALLDTTGSFLLEQPQFPGVQVIMRADIPNNNFWLGPTPGLAAKVP